MACGEDPAALTLKPSKTTSAQTSARFFFISAGGGLVSFGRSRCAVGFLAAFGRPRPCPLPLCACALCGRGPLPRPPLRGWGLPFSARWGCGRWCAFSLVFSVLRRVLFRGWGGFFGGWGGFFGGWAACLAPWFFVSLSRSLVRCCGRSPFLFGFCRGGCCRVLVSPLLVCGFRARHPRGRRLGSVGSCGRGVSRLRGRAGRARALLVVGRLVGGFFDRWLLGCVRAVGRCRRAWRPALFVLLIFFNICRVCGWFRPFGGGASTALDGGKSTYKAENQAFEVEI